VRKIDEMSHAEIIVAADQKKRVNQFPLKLAEEGPPESVASLFCLRCLAPPAWANGLTDLL